MSETRTAWPPWRIALWGIALALITWWRVPWFVQNLRPPEDTPLVDFFQEWSSARLFHDSLPIYQEQAKAVKRYFGKEVERNNPRQHFNEVNAHPPTTVLLIFPLSWLDFFVACLVWNLVSLALLGGSFWLVLRKLEIRLSVWALLPVFSFLLLCRPLAEQIVYGQWNGVLVGLIVGAWVAERSGRPWLAGGLLGAATAVKLFPGYLFLPFLVRRQWKVLLSGLVCIVLLNAVTAAVLGPEPFRDYALQVVPRLSKYPSYMVNMSLVGFWFKLFDAGAGQTVPIVFSPLAARVGSLFAAAAVSLFVMGASLRATSRRAQDHLFGVALTAMLLASPISWPHYFLLLLVPVLLLWRDLPPSGASRIVFFLCLLVMWLPLFLFWRLFISGNVLDFWKVVATPWQTLTVVSFHTYALLTLFVLGLRTLRDANHQALSGPVEEEAVHTIRRRLFQDLSPAPSIPSEAG
jgi:hypothetical protein